MKAETPVTFPGQQQGFIETDLLKQDSQPESPPDLRVNSYEIKTLQLRVGRQAPL